MSLLRVLADKNRVDGLLLRFCLELLRDYDLTQFRALKPRAMVKTDITHHRIAQHLRELVALGILERGPAVRAGRSKWMTPTYRVAPHHLLSPAAQAKAERAVLAMLERAALLPPASDPSEP
jgi:hypothetical protein